MPAPDLNALNPVYPVAPEYALSCISRNHPFPYQDLGIPAKLEPLDMTIPWAPNCRSSNWGQPTCSTTCGCVPVAQGVQIALSLATNSHGGHTWRGFFKRSWFNESGGILDGKIRNFDGLTRCQIGEAVRSRLNPAVWAGYAQSTYSYLLKNLSIHVLHNQNDLKICLSFHYLYWRTLPIASEIDEHTFRLRFSPIRRESPSLLACLFRVAVR